jgi:hypothetical protein
MNKGEIVWVKCSYVIPVIIPYDNCNEDFVIEDNGCPSTGIVGSALDSIKEMFDKKGCCWSCAFQGTNELVDPPKNEKELIELIK